MYFGDVINALGSALALQSDGTYAIRINGTVAGNLTITGNLVVQGTTTLQNTASITGLTTTTGPIRWSAGTALTAAQYEIGRNADATNAYQVNVPTGAAILWTENGVTRMQLATLGDFTLTQAVHTSGNPTGMTYTGGAHTTLANADVVDVFINGGRAVQFTGAAGGTTVTNARLASFAAPTYSTAGAGALTITNAGTLHVSMPSAGAGGGGTTLTNSRGLYILSGPAAQGTVTNIIGLDIANVAANNAGQTFSYAINIQNQTQPVGATFGINFAGTGTANSIRWGGAGAAVQFSNGGNNIRFSDSTFVNGIDFNMLPTANQTINTVTATTGSIVLQNQTFTAGGSHNAVQITPTWAQEDQTHLALRVLATQNGANSQTIAAYAAMIAKATGATVVGNAQGFFFQSPTGITGTITALSGVLIEGYGSGTITNNYGIRMGNFGNLANVTNSIAISIVSQTQSGTLSRAMDIEGTGLANAIRVGGSANIYSNAAQNVRFTDSTNVNGFDFNLLATAVQTIRTVTNTTGSISLQANTFTSGAAHNAVTIDPTWTTGDNFTHRGFQILPIQNGTNSDATGLVGFSVRAQQSGVGTLTQLTQIDISPPLAGGTITNTNGLLIQNQSLGGTASYGINISSQTANATTTRAINIAGTGANNAILFVGGGNLFSNGANNLRITDTSGTGAVGAGGLDFTLSTTTATLNSISVNGASLIFQNATWAATTLTTAVQITPTWAANNQSNTGLLISVTQNGANTMNMYGLNIQTTHANTGALGSLEGIIINSPTLSAGTITNTFGLEIFSQSTAGGGGLSYGMLIDSQSAQTGVTVRAIVLSGTGANNAIVLGNSPMVYSSGANVINFMDSTAARGITMTLTAAGTQTIAATTGILTLTTPDIGVAIGTSLTATGAIKSSSASTGIGYATGAGGTITQITSKSTLVTLNTIVGTITMTADALGDNTSVSFTLSNTSIAATDVVIVNHTSAGTAGAYIVSANAVAANSCKITVRNESGGSLSEAIVLTFAVIKGVTS